jgi:hypothetical protein
MRVPVRPLLLTLVIVATPAFADVLHLESGGRIEGRIIERNASTVAIEVGAGTMEFPMSAIARIESGRSVLDDYDERVAALADADIDGWLALGRWAAANDLPGQAKSAYRHVLDHDPGNAVANAALGRVEVDGRWLSEEDAYIARGYVKFDGEWMLPEEQAALELQRREQARADAARADARTAEARAREAEARARQAEADAQARQAEDDDVDYVYWPNRRPHRPIRPPQPPEPEPDTERPIRVPLKR